MAYRIRIENQARRTLEKLDSDVQRRVVEAIRRLADAPRPPGAKKMKNREGFRIRIGEHRVIYGVNDKESLVSVVKIGHRRDVYRAG